MQIYAFNLFDTHVRHYWRYMANIDRLARRQSTRRFISICRKATDELRSWTVESEHGHALLKQAR